MITLMVHVAFIPSSALLSLASPRQKLMTTFHSLRVMKRSCREPEASLHRSPANAVHDNLCAILVYNDAIVCCEQGLGCCTAWRGRGRRACTGCCWCALGLGSQGKRAAQKQDPCALCCGSSATALLMIRRSNLQAVWSSACRG